MATQADGECHDSTTTTGAFQEDAPLSTSTNAHDINSATIACEGKEPSWTCDKCTLVHWGQAKQIFLACELCASPRASNTTTDNNNLGTTKAHARAEEAKPASTNRSSSCKKSQQSTCTTTTTNDKNITKRSLAWGSLQPPTENNIRGKRRRHKGLDAPPPLLDYLVVLDLEWTADDRRRMEPIPEITQFPSVVMQLIQKKIRTKDTASLSTENTATSTTTATCTTNITLPLDLTIPSCDTPIMRQDAVAISAFDTFVRPTFNPILSEFSIRLTAITQEQVSAAPTVDIALERYMKWLESLDLVEDSVVGTRKGNWCFATWGDGDIMSTLRQELQYKNIPLPACFDRWINLKSDSIYQRHYGREPRGGLKSCVESVGATWEGRAHNGLVDSINTAKIVRHMVQTGFRFTRPTRGLGKDGVPFGQKQKQKTVHPINKISVVHTT